MVVMSFRTVTVFALALTLTITVVVGRRRNGHPCCRYVSYADGVGWRDRRGCSCSGRRRGEGRVIRREEKKWGE